MALSGTFTFKKNETIDCPISIDNVASHGSQKLLLKITLPTTAGILTSSISGSGCVGVFNRSVGVFQIAGTASEINSVLQSLRFQHNGNLMQNYSASVELRAYDDVPLFAGVGYAVFSTITLLPYEWPAVTWDSNPKAKFAVAASADTSVIRFPTVSDTGVGLLRATITPTDATLGEFLQPEAARDLGDVNTMAGDRDAVNAWLQSMLWKKKLITTEASYKITVTDGRTYKPAEHNFTVVLSPEISATDPLVIQSTSAIPVGASMLGGVFGTMTVMYSISNPSAGVFSKTQTTYGTVTPQVAGNQVVITGTNATDINAAMAGIRVTPAAGYPDATISITLHSSELGNLPPKTIKYRYNSPVLTGTKNLTVTEDTVQVFGSGLVVAPSSGLQTLVATIKVDQIGAATLAGGTWNASNGTLTITDTTSSGLQSAIAAVTVTPFLNRYAPFSLTITTSDNYGVASVVSVPVNIIPVDDPVYATGLTASRTWIEDSIYHFNSTPIVLGTVDEIEFATVTIVGDSNFQGSISSTAGGSWNAGTKTWTVSGAIETVNPVLNTLVYTPPTSEFRTSFTLSVTVRDAANTGPATATVQMTAKPFASFQAGYTYVEDVAKNMTSNTVNLPNDVDTMTLVMTLPANKGTITSPAGGTWDATSRIWQITGNQTAVQTALSSLTFTPIKDGYSTFNISWTATKGAKSLSGTITMTGQDVADPLIFSVPGNAVTHSNQYMKVTLPVTVSNPDTVSQYVPHTFELSMSHAPGAPWTSYPYAYVDFSGVGPVSGNQISHQNLDGINGSTYYVKNKWTGGSLADLQNLATNGQFYFVVGTRTEPNSFVATPVPNGVYSTQWDYGMVTLAPLSYTEDGPAVTIGNAIKFNGYFVVNETTSPIEIRSYPSGDPTNYRDYSISVSAPTTPSPLTVELYYQTGVGAWTFPAALAAATAPNRFESGSWNGPGWAGVTSDPFDSSTGALNPGWAVRKVTGTIAQINAAISAVTFKGAVNYSKPVPVLLRSYSISYESAYPESLLHSPLFIQPVANNDDFLVDGVGSGTMTYNGSTFSSGVGGLLSLLDDPDIELQSPKETKTWKIKLVQPSMGAIYASAYDVYTGSNQVGYGSEYNATHSMKSVSWAFKGTGAAPTPTLTQNPFAFSYTPAPIAKNAVNAKLSDFPTMVWATKNSPADIYVDITVTDGVYTKTGRKTLRPAGETDAFDVFITGTPRLQFNAGHGAYISFSGSQTRINGTEAQIQAALNSLYLPGPHGVAETATYQISSTYLYDNLNFNLQIVDFVSEPEHYTGNTPDQLTVVGGQKLSFPLRVVDTDNTMLYTVEFVASSTNSGSFDVQTDVTRTIANWTATDKTKDQMNDLLDAARYTASSTYLDGNGEQKFNVLWRLKKKVNGVRETIGSGYFYVTRT